MTDAVMHSRKLCIVYVVQRKPSKNSHSKNQDFLASIPHTTTIPHHLKCLSVTKEKKFLKLVKRNHLNKKLIYSAVLSLFTFTFSSNGA